MYRAGLTRARIAELVRAPASTVGYYLRIAVAADPGLRTAHGAAAARKTMVMAQGLERMQQLVTLVQQAGRYPSTNAESNSERALATWLQRRREDARPGHWRRPSGMVWRSCLAGRVSRVSKRTRAGGGSG